ncbi:store-operated calcium entry regulator STIMATE isoform X2 [Stegostoma tigrinum]|uniref:store-operated calcium entry regulator STIMATE isoform X2 n=1 Tax=Stegostoma tigrinum TaxID=3053191 RepID=UPI00202B412E|nr:store-operated calcium entry regulator STIMATE isoform X2 [Stegostoma tigrinum]
MAGSGLRSSDPVKRLLRRSLSVSNISIPLATAGVPAPGSRGCENGALMGNFGMFIQGLLGVVAFSLLMLKRFREPKYERRPWKIWYLINFLLDATLGMLLIYAGVRIVGVLVEWRHWESLRFGEYGDPLECSAWVGQCALYLLIMMLEKTVVIVVLLLPQWKKIALLNPIQNPQLELAIVMLIVPFFVNALMFWVVDNFLMRKGKTKAKLEGEVGEDESRSSNKVRYRRAASHEESESEILISADDEVDESEGDEDLRRLMNLKPVKKKLRFGGLPV